MNALSNLTPWQTLLWILALEMVSAPVLIILFNGIAAGYYKAKQAFIGNILGALGRTLEKAAENTQQKLEAQKTNKEQQAADFMNMLIKKMTEKNEDQRHE